MELANSTEELFKQLQQKQLNKQNTPQMGIGSQIYLQNKAGKLDFSEYSPY